MIKFSKMDDVKALQSNLRTLPIGHKENMKFLEELCGWFDFAETDPNLILIAHGKRQVLATIKTLLEFSPEQIVALALQKEN